MDACCCTVVIHEAESALEHQDLRNLSMLYCERECWDGRADACALSRVFLTVARADVCAPEREEKSEAGIRRVLEVLSGGGIYEYRPIQDVCRCQARDDTN